MPLERVFYIIVLEQNCFGKCFEAWLLYQGAKQTPVLILFVASLHIVCLGTSVANNSGLYPGIKS